MDQMGVLIVRAPRAWLRKEHFFLFWSNSVAVSLVIALTSACDAKSNQTPPMQVDGEDAVPSRIPDAKRVLEVTAPNYRPVAGLESECLGRLVFEVKNKIEWPVYYNVPHGSGFWGRSFSNNVRSSGDTLRFGNTYIAVIGSVSGSSKEKIFDITPPAREANLRELIERSRRYIDEQRRENKDAESLRREVKQREEFIQMWQKSIEEMREKFEPFDPGVPASYGYWTSTLEGGIYMTKYSNYRAYLTRGDYIYIFESTVKMDTPAAKEAHRRDFSAMLKSFRPRALHEIPTEPGVCIPYGFIPDDGRTVVEFKQSLRFPDAPGVLYTIETGTVHPRRSKAPLLHALAHASINPPPQMREDEARPVVIKRIGPQSVKMGGLSASQGGVVLQAGLEGQKYDIYNVFTGYGGWLGTYVLPYILVEMHTVNRAVATEITQHPPPFEQSKQRLDTLLGGMRWRPTSPPMAEFSSASDPPRPNRD
ncbi:hypothetical protein ABIB42_003315 [Massilia sp. UYP32]|nr:T6SS immunity protein Tli4 family protein [Massilia timonae]